MQLIKRHRGLGWEHIGDTKLLKSPRLWGTLLDQGLGLTAMIRWGINLGRNLACGGPFCAAGLKSRVAQEL